MLLSCGSAAMAGGMMLEARHGVAIEAAEPSAVSDLHRLGFADPVDASDRRLLALLSAFDHRSRLHVGLLPQSRRARDAPWPAPQEAP